MTDGSEAVFQADDSLQHNIADFLKNAEVTDGANASLDDVIGLQEAKTIMKECIILPIKFPLMCQERRKLQRFLVYGPPGVGKTMLIQAVVSEVLKNNTLCFRLSVYEFLSRINKSPTRSMEALFTRAGEQSPSIIILEDIEVLSGGDDLKKHALKEAFCSLESQMLERAKDTDIRFVIGVTNKPWILTTDIIRQFDSKIFISLPDDVERLGILKLHMRSVQNNLTDEQLGSLGNLMKGFTGWDIVVAARDASMQPIRRVQLATHFKKVSGSAVNNPDTCTDDLLTPCSPDDVGAMQMNWTDISPTQLSLQPVCLDDMRKSLTDMKPCVTGEELQLFETFHEKYGRV